MKKLFAGDGMEVAAGKRDVIINLNRKITTRNLGYLFFNLAEVPHESPAKFRLKVKYTNSARVQFRPKLLHIITNKRFIRTYELKLNLFGNVWFPKLPRVKIPIRRSIGEKQLIASATAWKSAREERSLYICAV